MTTIINKPRHGLPCFQYPKLAGTPTNDEWAEGKEFFGAATHRWPVECAALFHPVNEGKMTKTQGDRLNQQGRRAGTADYFLPWPSGRYHFFALELKRGDGGSISEDQAKFLLNINKAGGYGCVAYGADAALYALEKYLFDPENLPIVLC